MIRPLFVVPLLATIALGCAHREAAPAAASTPASPAAPEAKKTAVGPAGGTAETKSDNSPLPSLAPLPRFEIANSKRASVKRNEDALCTFQPTGERDAERAASATERACDAKLHLRAAAAVARGSASASAPAAVIPLRAEAGCYRVVVAFDGSAQDGAVLVRDADGATASEEVGAGPALVLPHDGTLCFKAADPNAAIVVSVGNGEGKFAVHVMRE